MQTRQETRQGHGSVAEPVAEAAEGSLAQTEAGAEQDSPADCCSVEHPSLVLVQPQHPRAPQQHHAFWLKPLRQCSPRLLQPACWLKHYHAFNFAQAGSAGQAEWSAITVAMALSTASILWIHFGGLWTSPIFSTTLRWVSTPCCFCMREIFIPTHSTSSHVYNIVSFII